jgi:hypothetical protein
VKRAILAAVLTASSATATLPQVPLATGTIDALLPAIKAANRCGVVAVRTVQNGARVSLYANTPVTNAALDCASRWIERNAKRLKLHLGP